MIEKLILNILVQYQFRSNILRIIEELTMNTPVCFAKYLGHNCLQPIVYQTTDIITEVKDSHKGNSKCRQKMNQNTRTM